MQPKEEAPQQRDVKPPRRKPKRRDAKEVPRYLLHTGLRAEEALEFFTVYQGLPNEGRNFKERADFNQAKDRVDPKIVGAMFTSPKGVYVWRRARMSQISAQEKDMLEDLFMRCYGKKVGTAALPVQFAWSFYFWKRAGQAINWAFFGLWSLDGQYRVCEMDNPASLRADWASYVQEKETRT